MFVDDEEEEERRRRGGGLLLFCGIFVDLSHVLSILYMTVEFRLW